VGEGGVESTKKTGGAGNHKKLNFKKILRKSVAVEEGKDEQEGKKVYQRGSRTENTAAVGGSGGPKKGG